MIHPPARLRPRTAAAALTAAVLLVLLGVLTASPAHATGYRYWSFWKWSAGAWTYQQQGPAVYVPPDGAVDGWRFAVSPDGGRDAARPGAGGDFDALCAATPAQAGRKRVAVVLDFGTAADAPPGTLAAGAAPPAARTACAVVPVAAGSAEVLAAVAPPLRYDTAGILCAIAGYPAAGCGEALSGPGPGAAGGGGGPNLGLVAGGAAVAVLAAGALWQTRRRR
ncbi:SCO2322 family protein [Kitasatospora sp. NBC_00315]|uniref:SCO2322 family protein n=1 Tax=Kitasatospora sp. NBC_00315 TaxID=2975963 RepID=UPI0032443D7D